MAHSLGGEGFDGFTYNDIAELIADKELSEDDLVNLVCESEPEKSDEELVPVTLTAKIIREGHALRRKLGNHFIQNDTTWHKSLLGSYEDVYKDLTKKFEELPIFYHLSECKYFCLKHRIGTNNFER